MVAFAMTECVVRPNPTFCQVSRAWSAGDSYSSRISRAHAPKGLANRLTICDAASKEFTFSCTHKSKCSGPEFIPSSSSPSDLISFSCSAWDMWRKSVGVGISSALLLVTLLLALPIDAMALARALDSLGPSAQIAAATTDSDEELERLELLVEQAVGAWEAGQDPSNSSRFEDLNEAAALFTAMIELEPSRTEWLEARGQVYLDAKLFQEAVADFTAAIEREPGNFHVYASRALAHEGLAEWEQAVKDYTRGLDLVKGRTGQEEPYILNSRGNALASMERYSEALQDYETSARLFQMSRELDGAIYAASNAALTRVQVGDEAGGLKELAAVARRAPASVDMRAAMAALYWAQGEEEKAEQQWRSACENINTGLVFDSCSLYRNQEWLSRIRRWPPVMVKNMDNFLGLRSSKASSIS